MDTINLYLDEAGNFDFGPNGTQYLILCCVKLPWNSGRVAQLAQLRHELLLEGVALEYFHASEDNRRVRARMFALLPGLLAPGAVHAVVIEKSRVAPEWRAPERFYPEFVGPLVLSHVAGALKPVFAFSDVLPLNRKRRGLEKAVAEELARRTAGAGTHSFLHHASKSNFDLQIADYCCWAIWRAWTKGDREALELLGAAVCVEMIT